MSKAPESTRAASRVYSKDNTGPWCDAVALNLFPYCTHFLFNHSFLFCSVCTECCVEHAKERYVYHFIVQL